MFRTTGKVILFAAGSLMLLLCLLPVRPGTASAAGFKLSQGETVYVPVYSNLFAGPRKRPLQLASTLSVRNTDRGATLRISAIEYYDTSGRLVQRHLDRPVTLGPLATYYLHREEKDVSGGFGANYLVRWQADKEINAPIIEAVMVGATSGQGISFVSPGQVIRE